RSLVAGSWLMAIHARSASLNQPGRAEDAHQRGNRRAGAMRERLLREDASPHNGASELDPSAIAKTCERAEWLVGRKLPGNQSSSRLPSTIRELVSISC